MWQVAFVIAVALILGNALYIQLRWRRSPQAYRSMIALAVGYFVAGALTGALALHLAASKPKVSAAGPSAPVAESSPMVTVPSAAVGQDRDFLPLRNAGKVASVTDGDTVDVALAPQGLVQSVRLAGIDAPEHEQAFGPDSTRHRSELVLGKAVTLQCEYERSYGRLICKVLLPNGDDVCLDQLKAGMAWHYK